MKNNDNENDWFEEMRIVSEWNKINYKCEASDVASYVNYLTSEIKQLKRKLYHKKKSVDPYRHLETFDIDNDDERPY